MSAQRSIVAAAALLLASCRGPGTPRVDRSGIDQVWVPAGAFTMGSSDRDLADVRAEGPPKWVERELASEAPAHVVHLSKGFWIDRHEVTNAAFARFVADRGYERREFWSEAGWAWLRGSDRSSLPAPCEGAEPAMPRRCVTWFEAEAYAAWRGGRLPTEAEWEYAARGPRSLRYPWGADFDPARCNVVDSKGPVAVGRYPGGSSWIGASDLAGNAMEWVADWLGSHDSAEVTDPKGPASGTIKIEKGGWWGANRFVARAAYRHYEDPPAYQDAHIGFRIVTDEAP